MASGSFHLCSLERHQELIEMLFVRLLLNYCSLMEPCEPASDHPYPEQNPYHNSLNPFHHNCLLSKNLEREKRDSLAESLFWLESYLVMQKAFSLNLRQER